MSATPRSEQPDAPADLPEVGVLARDTSRNKLGEVMARTPGTVWLRPVSGGVEWTADPECVRPVDELALKVAALNARRRQSR